MSSDNYTDYNYNVQIRIDSDSGEMVVFLFGQYSGEIGRPIHGGSDIDIAHSVGRSLVEAARSDEHGWESGETLEDHPHTWPASSNTDPDAPCTCVGDHDGHCASMRPIA